jgi:hypothetical protein
MESLSGLVGAMQLYFLPADSFGAKSPMHSSTRTSNDLTAETEFACGLRRMEMWKSPKNRDFAHFHRTTMTDTYIVFTRR